LAGTRSFVREISFDRDFSHTVFPLLDSVVPDAVFQPSPLFEEVPVSDVELATFGRQQIFPLDVDETKLLQPRDCSLHAGNAVTSDPRNGLLMRETIASGLAGQKTERLEDVSLTPGQRPNLRVPMKGLEDRFHRAPPALHRNEKIPHTEE
jgi:hypothetical protein